MAKLNQIIAVEKSVKSRAHGEITEAYQQLQKPALLAGKRQGLTNDLANFGYVGYVAHHSPLFASMHIIICLHA